MFNKPLISLDGSFEVSDCYGLVVAVGDKNVSRPVQIPDVVAFKISSVGSVVHNQRFEPYPSNV